MRADTGGDFDAALARVEEAVRASVAPTNLDRAARYELLGVIERLRSWRATSDERMIVECEVRISRIRRDARATQARLIEDVAACLRIATAVPLSRSLVDDEANAHDAETLELFERTLAGLSRGLRRWPTDDPPAPTWPIADEYGLQRLIYLVFAPTFRQLRYEVPLGMTGPPGWRPDFVFPDLGLALEAKYLRGPDRWPDTFRAIAEDDGHCRAAGSPFRTLAVVLWDDSKSTERHDEWQEALLGLAAVHAVTILSRPGVAR